MNARKKETTGVELKALMAYRARIVALICVGMVNSGCVSMVGIEEMEPVLERYVGQRLPEFQHPEEWSFKRHEIDEETFELVSIRPDKCNYVLVVNKEDLIVKRWYYVENRPPTDCTFQSVRQLM